MSIENLLSELNHNQHQAACLPSQHALILAGAGTGKTKTIVARAAYLISNGTPADKIQILAFTRRSASEIVERVRMHLGDEAQALRASTFHTWCMSLIRKAPKIFGCEGYSVIDRDDQLQLFKLLRGKVKKSELPTAVGLCDLYSLARNTTQSLAVTLKKEIPDFYPKIQKIAEIMVSYEQRKKERHYLDYDDILDVVAEHIAGSEKIRTWLTSQYEHLLIDEMQDTNLLQWKLIDPLKNNVTLFCVGDDAQSIYGFRGADFQNVHSFSERIKDSITLKLQDNYRSTQEILDASNWLLSQSDLNYGKKLLASRGSGKKPALNTFSNEWEEGRWIADDIFHKKNEGAKWKNHMILVRSGFAGRAIEPALLAREIPYKFIGGTKLLESAHIRDLLSVLRIVGNQQDEIAWMRFLCLWKGVGEVTASKIIDKTLYLEGDDKIIKLLREDEKLPDSAANAVEAVIANRFNVSDALQSAFVVMQGILADKYEKQDWDKRQRDIQIVRKLAEKHTSILGFIEEYVLDPIHIGDVGRKENDDVVTIITIHSAKGTESETCYVVNVSPGAYPSPYSIGDESAVEEERRVLYVALTRAKDELIVTRQERNTWAIRGVQKENETELETYFLNELPDNLFDEVMYSKPLPIVDKKAPDGVKGIHVGINIGDTSDIAEESAYEKSDTNDKYIDPVLILNGEANVQKDDEMAKKKIKIEQNEQMEKHTGIKIDACSAYYDSENTISIFGELSAINQSYIDEYKEIQFVAYDSNGEIIARNYTNWAEFGLMQSFELIEDLSDFETEPVKIKVYPSNG